MDIAPLDPEAGSPSPSLASTAVDEHGRPGGRAEVRPTTPDDLPTPGRRRAWPRAAAGGLLLVGLAGLTAWHATYSAALGTAAEAEARGDILAALRGALEHLDRRPWSRDAARVAARCLSRLDFAERAEPYYLRAGDLSIEDRHYRAYGLVRANLRERAVEAYRQILALRPGDLTSLRLQAGVLLSQERWDEAHEVARRLIEIPQGPLSALLPVAVADRWTLKPTRVASAPAIGYTLRGLLHHDLLESEAATEAFERVLAIDPDLQSIPLDPTHFWSLMVEDLLADGRAADALRYLARASEGREVPALLDLMGRAHLQQSAIDEAERCWRRAVELSPDHLHAWLSLGQIELRRDRADEAVRLFTRAAAIEPGSSEAAYGLALAHGRLGREDEARRYRAEADRLRRKPSKEARNLGATAPPPPPR